MARRPPSQFHLWYYESDTGSVPVKEFLEELKRRDPKAATKCESYMALLAMRGLELLTKHQYVDKVPDRENLYELRPEWNNVEYRLYFTLVGQSIAFVMVHAIKKKGRKAPPRDLDLAEKRAQQIHQGRANIDRAKL